jgi:excisionase family DNA binding protein
MAEPIFATPDEVAQVLRVSRSRVYQLIAAGELPSVRFGRRSVRVPLDALRRWAGEQEGVASRGSASSTSDRGNREP